MKGHFYKPRCTCENGKRCTCKATWAYIVDIGIDPQTGKRKQKKKSGFKTKAEAQKAVAILVTELDNGSYVKDSKITFSAFADEWLEIYINQKKIKKSTLLLRKQQIQKLNSYFAKIKLTQIDRKKYQDALNDLANKNYSKSYLISMHSTSNMMFKKALEMELLKKNPLNYTYVPVSKFEQKKNKVLRKKGAPKIFRLF